MKLTLIALVAILSLPAYSQSVVRLNASGQIYLRCPAPNEPEGVNDLHVDFDKKIITDSFARARTFREEGPFLVSETFAELDGEKTVMTTLRVNRYTYSYEFLWPLMNVYKRLQCAALDSQS